MAIIKSKIWPDIMFIIFSPLVSNDFEYFFVIISSL